MPALSPLRSIIPALTALTARPTVRWPAVLRGATGVLAVAHLAIAAPLAAQSGAADRYATQVTRGAFSVRDGQLSLAEAAARRQLARSFSLPSATVGSSRSSLSGNVLDVGRIVNPVYGALNQLLRQPLFPTDLTLRFPFRSQTGVHVSQPLFAPSAWAATRAAGAAERAERANVDARSAAAELEVRMAWLQWYRAGAVHGVYDEAAASLRALRTQQQRLLDAGAITPDAILRVDAEVAAVESERSRLQAQQAALATRLNHLLARRLDLPIDGDTLKAATPLPTLEALMASAASRPEQRQLAATASAVEANARGTRAAFLPTVGVTFDYGWQGEDARLRGDREFRILSVVGQWNVFAGGADRARVDLADVEQRRVALRREEVVSLIEAEVRGTYALARAALEALPAADAQYQSAQRAFELAQRRLAAGAAIPLEVLNARQAVTTAAVQRMVALADYHGRRLELFHAAALNP